jgi:hypothetical protein
MIADPEVPSFIVRTVGRRWYSDGAFVTHDPVRTTLLGGDNLAPLKTHRYCEAIGIRMENAASYPQFWRGAPVASAPGDPDGNGRAV